VIDFDKLEEHIEDFKGFEAGYSCLGTTRGKSGAVRIIYIEGENYLYFIM